MNCRIRLHRLRTSHDPRTTPSPPSSSPDERTNDGMLGRVARAPQTSRWMMTTPIILTEEQNRHNDLEDTREYHDERIDELALEDTRTYSRC